VHGSRKEDSKLETTVAATTKLGGKRMGKKCAESSGEHGCKNEEHEEEDK